jgi:hypothetical protein
LRLALEHEVLPVARLAGAVTAPGLGGEKVLMAGGDDLGHGAPGRAGRTFLEPPGLAQDEAGQQECAGRDEDPAARVHGQTPCPCPAAASCGGPLAFLGQRDVELTSHLNGSQTDATAVPKRRAGRAFSTEWDTTRCPAWPWTVKPVRGSFRGTSKGTGTNYKRSRRTYNRRRAAPLRLCQLHGLDTGSRKKVQSSIREAAGAGFPRRRRTESAGAARRAGSLD